MTKYAVVKIGGSQLKIAEGDEAEIPKIESSKKTLIFDQVLLLVDKDKVEIGQPILAKARVEAKLIKEFKGKKVRVATFKAKARYRKVKGFRPSLLKIKIEKITS